jgi:glucuronate isomerase
LLNPWVDRLEAVQQHSIGTLADFVDALRQRHDFFHQMGGRLSDHGLNHAFADFPPSTKPRRFSAGRAAVMPPRPRSMAGSPPT